MFLAFSKRIEISTVYQRGLLAICLLLRIKTAVNTDADNASNPANQPTAVSSPVFTPLAPVWEVVSSPVLVFPVPVVPDVFLITATFNTLPSSYKASAV